MSDASKGKRLAAVLYFVAAGLAFTAGLGGFFSERQDISWGTAAAGLFCVAMGVSTWRRAADPKA